MRPTVRLATPADLDRLERSFGQRRYFASRLRRRPGHRGLLLVAELTGDLVGDAYLRLEPADEQVLRERLPGVPLLQHVEVRSDRRRRGVGSALLHEAEALLWEFDYARVALGVALDNHAATRLYLRRGYRRWPYPPITTVYEEYLDNGRRQRGSEVCHILVKELG